MTNQDLEALLRANGGGGRGGMRFIIVETLPTEDIDEGAIYLIARVDPQQGNVYDEYVYVEGEWEKLGGSVEIDLSDYYTKTETETAITEKGYQTSQQVETAITAKGYQTSQQVETAITGKGYQTSQQVENAINARVSQHQITSVVIGTDTIDITIS